MTSAFTGSSRAATFLLIQPSRTIHAFPRSLSQRHGILGVTFASRSYSSSSKPATTFNTKRNAVITQPTKTEAESTDLELYGDGINPPLTTLPPPLTLPEKKPETSKPVHWYHIGRAYGKFYITGVKQTWSNYKKARGLRQRIRASNAQSEDNYPPRRLLGLLSPPLLLDFEIYMRREGATRSQLQLLVREREDVKKLPLFALLVAVFGEWLPLIVPFIPGRVPKTCRIPKQVAGMRQAVEDRRKASFRSAVMGPFEKGEEAGMVLKGIRARVLKTAQIEEKTEKENKSLKPDEADAEADLDEQEAGDVMALRMQPASWLAVEMTQALDRRGLAHVSTNLGLHGKFWERLGLVGDSAFTPVLLKMRVAKRLHYLNLDDELLVKEKTKDFHALSSQEVDIACEERGIDVTGRKEEALRKDLSKWLDGRAKDKNYGEEVMKMLFKRPNSW